MRASHVAGDLVVARVNFCCPICCLQLCLRCCEYPVWESVLLSTAEGAIRPESLRQTILLGGLA